jgi:hypothetical protein
MKGVEKNPSEGGCVTPKISNVFRVKIVIHVGASTLKNFCGTKKFPGLAAEISRDKISCAKSDLISN